MRPIRFEEVAAALRLIRRAVEHGCRGHYDARQREGVVATYTASFFADAPGPLEIIVAELQGVLVGVGQLDCVSDRPRAGLRALFVDGERQQRGLGRALLADLEARARRRGCLRLRGAMALNAVPFYTAAGFRPAAGSDRLIAGGVAVPVLRMDKAL